ncbi:hypothetical protein K440DRAFT_635660, partial [Wilcoxina mikolae CBS 423.85]
MHAYSSANHRLQIATTTYDVPASHRTPATASGLSIQTNIHPSGASEQYISPLPNLMLAFSIH